MVDSIERPTELDTLILEITEVCPLNCRGCFKPATPREMDVASVERICKTIPPVDTFILSGGEPLIHTHLVPVLDTLNKHGIKPNIFTSGCVNQEILPKIKDKISSLSISLKYNMDDLDSKWRGFEDSNSKTIEFIKEARKNKITVYLHNVVDKLNIKWIESFFYLGKRYDLNIVFIPFMAYNKHDKQLVLSKRELKNLVKIAKKRGADVEMAEEYCQAGFKRIAINSKGDIRPCLFLPDEFNMGNIFEEDFNEVWYKLQDWRLQQGEKIVCPVIKWSEGL